MTPRQRQLVDCEISRHIALAMVSREPVIKCGHMEVAQALTAALATAEERRNRRWRIFNWVRPILSCLRRL